MQPITYFVDSPLTQALSQRYGSNLEQLTAVDKLDIAHLLLTTIAWGDNTGQSKTLGSAIAELGTVYPDAPNTEAVAAEIDKHPTSIEELFGIAAVLCLHLHEGVYADAQ